MPGKVNRSAGFGFWFFPVAAALFLILWSASSASAQGAYRTNGSEGPLTQADIDGYVYLLPRLGPQLASSGDQAAQVLRDSGLSRRRAAYVASKVAITQALATGLLSTSQMRSDQVPLHLQPSTEELELVIKNLNTIQRAQQRSR